MDRQAAADELMKFIQAQPSPRELALLILRQWREANAT